jgi:hypothetical protein
MSAVPARRGRLKVDPVSPLLESGDRMTQAEFHRRYEGCADNVKFELVGGIVYMASPQRRLHSRLDEVLGLGMTFYRLGTPGVEMLRNTTTILGKRSEPQPDLALRILPEFAGQSRTTEVDYIEGPPELLAEIAHSTRAIDMHRKRDDYRGGGVLEYIVVCVEEKELHWFDFKARRTLRPTPQGVYRSRVFPGFWIDGPALFELDAQRVLDVLREGLATPEHAAFAEELAKRQ